MFVVKRSNLVDPEVSELEDNNPERLEDTPPEDHSLSDLTADQSQPQIPLDQVLSLTEELLTLERSDPVILLDKLAPSLSIDVKKLILSAIRVQWNENKIW